MKFDEDRIRKLTSELITSLTRLQDLTRLPREEFVSDPHKVGSAKYHFIVAIEAAIDMCNHVIRKNGFRAPEDYADTFRVMGEVGAFDSEFVKNLVRMAKFRNRLVHLYWAVDDTEVYRILREETDDLEQFLVRFGRFLGKDLRETS